MLIGLCRRDILGLLGFERARFKHDGACLEEVFRILTNFLGDIIFRGVTIGHHPPMTGFHRRVFVVLVLVFVIFLVVFVVIIKERMQQPKRGERERQVEIIQYF